MKIKSTRPSKIFKEHICESLSKSPQDKKQDSKTTKSANYKRDFIYYFQKLCYKHNQFEAWKDFVTLFSCAISNALDNSNYEERERKYKRIIKKYTESEQKIFPQLAATTVLALESNPEQDFLGEIYMSLNLGSIYNGQFFTPYHVCELMAEVTMEDIVQTVKEKGYISINDPCCGAGATLIAGIHSARKRLEKANINYQNHVLVIAQDIDVTAALMCYIQLSLQGVAGCVKIGNSLTDPIANNDSNENCWFTPMYFSPTWTMRRVEL